MKKAVLFFCLFWFESFLQAQPYLSRNYNSADFKAHRLIWDMQQDRDGRLWFANNEGILRFDGNNWVKFPTPVPIRSLAFTADGRLMAGGLGDYGNYAFKSDGTSGFISLNPLSKDTLTGSIETQVITVAGTTFFYNQKGIHQLEWSNGVYTTSRLPIDDPSGCASNGKVMYVNSATKGLGSLQHGKFKPVLQGLQFAGKDITGAALLNQDLFLSTNYHGLYRLRNNQLEPLSAPIQTFAQYGVSAIAVINNAFIAVATLHHGVRLFLPDLTHHTTLSLPSDEIYSLYVDHEQNLWVAHAKGLTQVLINVPVQPISTPSITGTISDMHLEGNQLYLATTGGLFSLQTNNPQIQNQLSKNECWDIDDHWLATTDGLFRIRENTVIPVLPNETFLHIQKGNRQPVRYAFGLNGIEKFNETDALNQPGKVDEVHELATSLYENEDGSYWIGTYFHGLLHVPSGNTSIQVPDALQKGEVTIRMMHDKPVFLSRDGAYTLEGNSFKPDAALSASLGQSKNRAFTFTTEPWIIRDEGLRHLRNQTEVIPSAAYVLDGRPTAFCIDGNALWVATEDKLYKIENKYAATPNLKTSISRISLGSGGICFDGVHSKTDETLSDNQEIKPEISYNAPMLRIEFGMNSFVNPQKNRYSFWIEGLNNSWSDWSAASYINLQGIGGGNYTLHIKGMNALGELAEESTFQFYIKPPWYRSGYAYLLYACLLGLIIYLFILLNNKRLINKNNELEIKVEERTHELKQEKQKSDELLLNILPAEVAEELKRKGETTARQFDQVSVLFTDFVGFTTISEHLTPKELVSEIHYCFKAFDAIIEKNELEKIKTIGDAYLAVCGLPQADKHHAIKVVQAAIDILDFIKSYQDERKQQQKEYFEIRIGIHSGPVVAGIVGMKKFAYDIWGDTVNTAARMEQTSEAGKINISGTTHELVKKTYPCTYRGKIKAKNKGEIDMYFVN
ncbi:MAG: adenylate/guanylate cyclase domain-containing protein [Bacteroidia bacterium]|jgi:class 3 adenylate cyclase